MLTLCAGCTQRANFGESEIFERSEDQIELQYGLARMLERKKLFKEARDSFLEIIDSKSNYAPALHRLGVVSIRLDALDDGLEYFERAIDNTAEDAELLADYGYALFLSGDITGAKLRLTTARELDPSNQRVINNLAIIVGSEGETEKSLDLFRLVNSEANALCNVGFVLSQNDKTKKAKEYFHRALDLNPKLKKAANGLIQIHQNEDPVMEEESDDENVIAESSLDKPSTIDKPKRGNVLNLVRESTIKNRSKPLRSMLEEDASVSSAATNDDDDEAR